MHREQLYTHYFMLSGTKQILDPVSALESLMLFTHIAGSPLTVANAKTFERIREISPHLLNPSKFLSTAEMTTTKNPKTFDNQLSEACTESESLRFVALSMPPFHQCFLTKTNKSLNRLLLLASSA